MFSVTVITLERFLVVRDSPNDVSVINYNSGEILRS